MMTLRRTRHTIQRRFKKRNIKTRQTYKQRGGGYIFSPLDNNPRFTFNRVMIKGDEYVKILDNETKQIYIISLKMEIRNENNFTYANKNSIIWLLHTDNRILYCNINGEPINEEQEVANQNAIKELLGPTAKLNRIKMKKVYNINVVRIRDENSCTSDINVDDINRALYELNRLLNLKCKGYRLEFGSKFNMSNDATYYSNYLEYEYVLCLYINDTQCVSSIEIDIKRDKKLDTNILEINIITHKQYGGKKYMYLLCCALMLISDVIKCTHFDKIDSIYAVSINPVTTNILLSIFDDYTVINQRNENLTDAFKHMFNHKKMHPNNSLLDKIKKFDSFGVNIYMPINDTNKTCARKLFNELTANPDTGIKCV